MDNRISSLIEQILSQFIDILSQQILSVKAKEIKLHNIRRPNVIVWTVYFCT